MAPRKRPTRETSESLEKAPPASLGRMAAFVRGAMLKGWPRIDLKHLTEEGVNHIRTWSVSGGADADAENTEDGAEACAHEILTTATEDAMVLGGHQKFFALAYDKNNLQKHRFAFTVHGEDGNANEDNGPSESATPKGIVAQMMRHVETIQRNSMGATADIMANYQLQLAHATQQLHAYQQRELDEMRLREDLISQKHVRDLEMLQEARKEKFQGEMVEKLMSLGNIAVARLMTGGKAGVKPDPMMGEEILKGILGNVLADDKKLSAIAGALGPQDSAALFELAKMYTDRDAKKEEAAQAKQLEASKGGQ